MTNQNNAAQAANKEIREAFELSYAMDADDPASVTDLSHFTNGWRALLSTLRAPVADERAAILRDLAQHASEASDHTPSSFNAGVIRLANRARAALASAPVAGEALFWYRPRSDGWYEGPIHNDRIEEARKLSGAWVPPVAAPQASAEAFDFAAHLVRQAEFSALTFGPGARVAGVCDHIRKELIEVETSGGDLKEWVDVIILGLDGAWRSGATPQEIIAAIVAKQAKNEARTWPDWRTMDPNKAIEHQRTAAPCTCPSGDGSLRHPCAVHPADRQQHAEVTEAQCFAVYQALDEFGRDIDIYEYGLPYLSDDHRQQKAVEIIRAALSATQPEQGERDA